MRHVVDCAALRRRRKIKGIRPAIYLGVIVCERIIILEGAALCGRHRQAVEQHLNASAPREGAADDTRSAHGETNCFAAGSRLRDKARLKAKGIRDVASAATFDLIRRNDRDVACHFTDFVGAIARLDDDFTPVGGVSSVRCICLCGGGSVCAARPSQCQCARCQRQLQGDFLPHGTSGL